MKPQYSYESFYVNPSYISIVAVTPLGTQKNVLNTYKPKKKKIIKHYCVYVKADVVHVLRHKWIRHHINLFGMLIFSLRKLTHV